MQMEDYQKARDYYEAAIKNIKKKISDENEDPDRDSNKQYFDIGQKGPNQFLLACRHYMRGMAGFGALKQEFPVRQLLLDLKGTTQQIDMRKSVEKRREQKELDFFFERGVRRESSKEIDEIIDAAKKDFLEAVQSLPLDEGANHNLQQSVLDCAIHIAFQMLELTLYKRAIDGTDFKTNHRQDIIDGKERCWDNLIDPEDKKTAKYLYMINDLKTLQQSPDEQSELFGGRIFTQEFANEYRQGLRVVPYQTCLQLETYCKGFYLHHCSNILLNHIQDYQEASELIEEALKFYSESLQVSGEQSNSYIRLKTLEAIELIIRDKALKEKKTDSNTGRGSFLHN